MDINQKLQSKYPNLEISVLKYSEVLKDNDNKRIDSEYFKKENLENERILNFFEFKIDDFIVKNFKNIKSFKLNKNFEYLQISDINLQNGLENSTNIIDYNEIPDRATYVLRKNDICVSNVRPNRNAVAFIKKPKRLIGTSGFTILRLNNDCVLPEFLYIFCKTKFFIKKLMRENTASLYPAVLDKDIYNVKIPILPMEFQLEIEKLVKNSYKNLEQSKVLYKEAENLLYTEFGLSLQNGKICIKNRSNISIRSLKDSFLSTGRLDAEYYQSKFDDIERLIKNYHGGYSKLSDFFSQKKENSNFSDNEYNYIEIGDISVGNGTVKYNLIPKTELPANAKISLSKNDILVSKVRPNRGAVAIIDFEVENLIGSNAFVVLCEKGNYKKEVLQVLLRSDIYKTLLLRYNVGTSYPVIKDENVLNILIPKFPLKTQESIARNLQESFRLRNEAKILLDQAKQSVENAIIAGGGNS